jgi:hypothetical protein
MLGFSICLQILSYQSKNIICSPVSQEDLEQLHQFILLISVLEEIICGIDLLSLYYSLMVQFISYAPLCHLEGRQMMVLSPFHFSLAVF